MKKVLITGGAGFIGSTLAEKLVTENINVTVLDNFSTGRREFLTGLTANPLLKVVEGDVLDQELLAESMHGCDAVFHLAANADVRYGLNHPNRDLEQNTLGTFNVLEAMRHTEVKRIVFASTGSIYGEPDVFPTPEDCPFPSQTSLYGASKLAGEGLIQAYSNGFGFTGSIFRFVSILGERYTHGHVYDFYSNLKENPAELTILGNGKQKKSYLYVQDCINGILSGMAVTQEGKTAIYNLGRDDTIIVDESAKIITEALNLKPEIKYSGGERGWPGDSPFILLDCSKLRKTGWAPTLSIEESIRQTVKWFDQNEWIFN